jgi:hypothetical protein
MHVNVHTSLSYLLSVSYSPKPSLDMQFAHWPAKDTKCHSCLCHVKKRVELTFALCPPPPSFLFTPIYHLITPFTHLLHCISPKHIPLYTGYD